MPGGVFSIGTLQNSVKPALDQSVGEKRLEMGSYTPVLRTQEGHHDQLCLWAAEGFTEQGHLLKGSVTTVVHDIWLS